MYPVEWSDHAIPKFWQRPQKGYSSDSSSVWRWHDDRTLSLSLLLELLYAAQNFKLMTDLMKTRGHAKRSLVRVFLFLSLFLESMDILAGLMENLLEPWCHTGYKDVMYGGLNHKTFDIWVRRELVDLF